MIFRGQQNKHVQTFLAYSQDFSNTCSETKIWSVALRPEQKPHRVSSKLG